MRLQEDMRSLAGALGADGRDRGATLVLGAAVPTAAGVPPFEDLVAKSGYASKSGLGDSSPTDRRVVERLLWNIAVPPFYYDVAGLVRNGTFPRVITTGYDDLLERALSDAGLRPGNHFVVTDIAADTRPPATSARIRIARCYGASSISHSAMERALAGRYGKGRDRFVVVGYGFETPALEAWLGRLDGGQLWWVAQAGEGDAQSRIRWAGEWHTLEGEPAAPATFFGQLALLLQHLPDATGGSEVAGGTVAPNEEELDEIFLQGRINLANTVKRSVEQRIVSVGADPAAITQLTAQTDEIARLQEEAAGKLTAQPGDDAPPSVEAASSEATPNAAEALLERYHALRGRLGPLVGDATAPVDADTVSFVDSQIGALEREATKSQPNSLVVSAASAGLDGLERQVAGYLDQRGS